MLKNMSNYLHISKQSRTFAASLEETKILTFICAVFFIAISIGCHSNSYCAEKSVIVSSKTEKGSLSSFSTFNFSFMEETMKNQSSPKNSKTNLTPHSAKTVKSTLGKPADITVQITGKKNRVIHGYATVIYRFFQEESAGFIFTEYRLKSGIEAARTLYPDDWKALRGLTVKFM